MVDLGKKIKQSIKNTALGEAEFALKKFLLCAEVIEQKQKLLGKKMDELWEKIKLREVYQKIVSQD